MAKFETLTSHAVPLPAENVDTDQIIPARFLKVTTKEGLGEKLFCDWRYDGEGKPNPDFVLNHPESKGAQILLAGNNFGSGSSREHAPWALHDWGIRAIVSTGFADIFKSNSLKNGVLPVEVDADTHAQLLQKVQRDRDTQIHIDLKSQTLSGPDGLETEFDIDGFSKHCLLNGIDQLGYILGFEEQIRAHEEK